MERARLRGCARIQLDANERNEAALPFTPRLASSRGSPARWDGARDLYLTNWL